MHVSGALPSVASTIKMHEMFCFRFEITKVSCGRRLSSLGGLIAKQLTEMGGRLNF